jgi:hypothetical protein
MALGRGGSYFAVILGALLAAYGGLGVVLVLTDSRPMTAQLGNAVLGVVLIALGAWCLLGGRANLRRLASHSKNPPARPTE